MLTERRLIVITGPVGGGKSSTALALAHALRPTGLAVAVIDLDQLYGVVRQPRGDDEIAWNLARAGAAGLANALFGKGVPVVVVEGEFFTPEELVALLEAHLEQSEPADVRSALQVILERYRNVGP